MKHVLWLCSALVLLSCGVSPVARTVDLASRDATSIAQQVATIDARNTAASPPLTATMASSTATPTPQPSATTAPTATSIEPFARLLPDNDHANIRSGPGLDYPIVATLQPSVTAPITGRNDDESWWQIDLNNVSGWVIGQLIETLGMTTSVQPRQAAPPPTGTPSPQPSVSAKAVATPPAPAPAAQAQAAVVRPTATTAALQTGRGCNTGAGYDLLPRDGPASDRPDRMHGDLNLALRGYSSTDAPATLIGYNGASDPNAPQLAGMFQPNRVAAIQSVYRVNLWYFESSRCNGAPYGCAGPAITNWPVTMIGLATTPGEPIAIPARAPQIGSGYQALVLFADATRIMINYTRQDNISYGYVVYIENVCVDSNLLALYRAQNNADGWRSSVNLPALRNNQPLGVAAGSEIRVAIRDTATFMDPRSRKDWWH